MRKRDPAPPIPGVDELAACPCCGAVWQSGKPWEGTYLTPTELAERMGTTQQTVTSRIRKGTIAAHLAAGRGPRNNYMIPIHEAERLAGEPGRPLAVEDLSHG